MLLAEGREQCLDGRVPANLISCGLDMPHVGLHRDLKDAPLNIIAWTSTSGGRGSPETLMIGGQFVLPSLGVLFTPGATADVTVVLIASAVLTHGTLPLRVTGGLGARLGSSHFLRFEDVLWAAAVKRGAMEHYRAESCEKAIELMGAEEESVRLQLRKQFIASAEKEVLGLVFGAPLVKYKAALAAGSSSPLADRFHPWFPVINEELKTR